MKAIIIDDEKLARELIKKFLEEVPDIEVIAEAENGFKGAKLINSLKPDLVFLDIQMPKLSGLEMLDLIHEAPVIIFSTAFDEYALEAFERNAIDYLLKPFSRERFNVALNKAREKFVIHSGSSLEIDRLKEINQHEERIVIKTGTKIHLIDFENILYIAADGDYIAFHTDSGKFLKQQTMKSIEKELNTSFVRVHRSFIVHTAAIEKIELYTKDSYQLLLKNKEKIPVSRSGYDLLKAKLAW